MDSMYRNIAIVLGVLIVGVGAYFALSVFSGPAQDIPEREDFGQAVPPNFPTDIPIEAGAQVEQSYGLNEQTGSEQLTIVFVSGKSVKENYDLYLSFLKDGEWDVLNTHEDPALSALYGTKEQYDINVTISEYSSSGIVASQVSISVLKKI